MSNLGINSSRRFKETKFLKSRKALLRCAWIVPTLRKTSPKTLYIYFKLTFLQAKVKGSNIKLPDQIQVTFRRAFGRAILVFVLHYVF